MSLFQRETQETYTAVLNSSLNEELRTEENVASKSFLLSRELNYRSIIGNRNMIVLLYSLCVRKPVILRVSFSSFLKRVMLPQALKKWVTPSLMPTKMGSLQRQQNSFNEKALRETQTLRAAYAMQAGSVLHICTKFEADCSIRSISY